MPVPSHALRPLPASPFPTPNTPSRCDLRPCGILSLRRADTGRRAESQQPAEAERPAELSAKLRLWRLLFFALSEYLVST